MQKQYDLVKDPLVAKDISNMMMDCKSVAVDTETTGLDPHVDKVILLSISSKAHGTYVIDTRDTRCLEVFRPVLENDNIFKVMHNGTFDYKMIKGTCGIDTENIFCTQLGEETLTVGLQFDGYSLEAITKKYLGKERDKSLQKSFIGHTGEFTPEQVMYAAEDTSDLLTICDCIITEARLKSLVKIWKIESAAIPSFGDIEYYGQLIDKNKWEAVINENQRRAALAKADLDFYFAPVCSQMFDVDGVSKDGFVIDMNYESQPMMLEKLRMLGVEVDGQLITDTNKKTQKKLQSHPIMQALAKYRTANHGIKQFGYQYLKAIHPKTGRVHFRFNQYGTETGRTACRGGLNCLNIPREQRYRECFTTDPNRRISTVDYSGAELRIMAELSGDPLMVNGFNSGVDFHCYVASMLFNKEVTKKNENAHLRTPTKTLNFGLAYGMGPGSLYEQLNAANYKISLNECRELFYKYMDTFKTTIAWLKSQQRHASTHFKMSNINGRTRQWYKPDREKIRTKLEGELSKKGTWKNLSELQINGLIDEKVRAHTAAIEREGANFQIQSVNADFTKVAMARCRKEFKKRGWDARTYNSVYDEIVYDFHESCAEEAHEVQKKIMLDAANEMLKKVPMDVEGHLDRVWQK